MSANGGSNSIFPIQELCRRGIAMEYDTIAREKHRDNHREIEIVRAPLDSGFQSQLLMSLDVTRARLIRYGEQEGLDYILNVFLGYCKNQGISDAVLAVSYRCREWSLKE